MTAEPYVWQPPEPDGLDVRTGVLLDLVDSMAYLMARGYCPRCVTRHPRSEPCPDATIEIGEL